MPINSLAELLETELQDLFSAENQLLKALPKLADKAVEPKLKDAFTAHLAETEGHVGRLEIIAEELGLKLTGHKCKAMEGLVAEGNEVIDEPGRGPVIDAALIGAAQRVEHYEMAAYGTVRAMAKELGYEKVVRLLQSTLNEEAAADKKLTAIAESSVLATARATSDRDDDADEKTPPRTRG